ncbi:alpha/beta hydrolase-fold protein [Algibacter sp.]|nr:alpha/beta hydrolase-fold protein [Algibacter sp.]
MKNTIQHSNKTSIETERIWVFMMLPFFLLLMSSCSEKDVNSTSDSKDKLGAFNSKTIQHDGVERTYHMYLPTNFDTSNATPLVLALHGGGGTGSNFEAIVSAGTLTTAAESRGMILLMPDGIDKRWNDGRPEIFGSDPMYNDVDFIATIIDVMIQDYGVDANRVYVTGISNGGLMSMRLAMGLSNKIAAIAPVTAQITEAIQDEVPELPMPIMLVNGTDDALVPYFGGCILGPFVEDCTRGEVLSTDETINKFVGFNQCENTSETEPIIDTDTTDNTSVEITRYTDCEQDTEVVLVKVIGGGHTWPNGAQYLPVSLVGRVSQEINASEMILDFFLRHSRG